MKKRFVVLFFILLSSCNVQLKTRPRCVELYVRHELNPNIRPLFLLLRVQPQLYELYSPQDGTIGEWRINDDTLFLFPKCEWQYHNNGIFFTEVESKEISISTIPQKFLIMKDSLTDITDYGIVYRELPGLFYDSSCHEKDVFKRIRRFPRSYLSHE